MCQITSPTLQRDDHENLITLILQNILLTNLAPFWHNGYKFGGLL